MMLRRVFPLCFILLSAPLAAQAVTFHPVPLSPGAERTLIRQRSLQMTVDSSGGSDAGMLSESMNVDIKATFEEKVLEPSSDGAARSRIVFNEVTYNTPAKGPAEPITPPPTGVPFILTRRDSGLTVMNENGTPAADAVRNFFHDFLKDDDADRQCVEAFGGKTVSVGDVIPLTAEQSPLGPMAGLDSTASAEFQAKAREVREIDGRPCMVFDLSLVVAGEFFSILLDIRMQGTMIVDVETCRPLEYALDGTMMLSFQSEGEGSQSMTISGAIGLHQTAKYVSWK
jgi:hypothetical protein